MRPAALPDSPPVEPADPDLLPLVRSGDADALDAVYRRHTPDLLGLAERLCGSRADAEDVVHDVFVGLPKALAKYEERGKFAAWLRRLTVRRALTQVRQRQREIALVPETIVQERSLDHAALRQAIDSLPDTLQIAFVLHVVEGYTHPEIATMLGIGRSASRVRVFRAIRRLRSLLEEA